MWKSCLLIYHTTTTKFSPNYKSPAPRPGDSWWLCGAIFWLSTSQKTHQMSAYRSRHCYQWETLSLLEENCEVQSWESGHYYMTQGNQRGLNIHHQQQRGYHKGGLPTAAISISGTHQFSSLITARFWEKATVSRLHSCPDWQMGPNAVVLAISKSTNIWLKHKNIISIS